MNDTLAATSSTQLDNGCLTGADTHTSPRRAPMTTRFARTAVLKSLDKLQHGHLTLIDGGDVSTAGDEAEKTQRATLTVHDSSFYSRVLFGGSLGVAEAYMDGLWSCDHLTALIRIFAPKLEASNALDRGWSWLKGRLASGYHAFRPNTRRGARRNIHEHYDLGNEFFSLFLDETMMYSSALFESPDVSLHDASVAKLDRICRKLQLQPGDHVLEIGTGWGGFAEHAARNYGCRVTTTTISREQFDFAQNRIDKAGLSEQVELLLEDYRDLTGQYDKLVSIEMIEAVGHKFFDTYFKTCGRLLKPDGLMLLQGITLPDQRYQQYLRSVDFIQRYIFPGGCLPSLKAMGDSVASQTDMRMLHLEDLAPHYAQTLSCWRDRFFDRIDEVRELGFSDRFIRMWEYYFCYCEAAFLERATGVVQLLLAKPQCHLDPIRTF
jgi:cyclopropane-fatty-acyl-phospholipid synthase